MRNSDGAFSRRKSRQNLLMLEWSEPWSGQNHGGVRTVEGLEPWGVRTVEGLEPWSGQNCGAVRTMER